MPPNGPDDPPPDGATRRFAVDMPAVVKALATGELAAGRAVNVSATGAFVTSRRTFPVGTPVRVTLALPVEFGDLRVRRLVARATVRWINDARAPRAAHLPSGMGLEFLDLDPAKRREIDVLLRDRLAAPGWSPAGGSPHASPPDSGAAPGVTAAGVRDDPYPVDPRGAVAGTGEAIGGEHDGRGGEQDAGGDPCDLERRAPEPAATLPVEHGAEDRAVERPAAAAAGPSTHGLATARTPVSGGGRFRLLLADPDVRELLAREGVFRYRAGHEIHVAATGEELVRLAGRARPMMIIFDADRLDTALRPTIARVRRLPMLRTTPLVATASRVADTERRLRGSGVDLVLAKPVDRQRLYGVLRLLGPESGLDIRVAVGTEVRYVADGVEREGRVVNLSRGGLYLAAEPQSPVGAALAVQLQLPGFTHATPVAGVVRWVNDGDLAPALPPGMGVQFLGTSPAALKTVATYVVLARNVVRVT